MQSLDRALRNKLERAVMEARDVAEAAARAAVEQLGVGEAKPYPHLSAEEKELRRKLRAHGRQLGDVRHGKTEVQEVDHLMEEVAYEHWHRMLFARFLAENNLLMYPDPKQPVAVSLEECEDLAVEEGAKNGWELASRFAARMLPQIFRPSSPVFQLALPPEHQQKLEQLVAGLERATFTATDSLGWVYQFWQAKKKDEVNASEVKIGARELPAVTQLFTEPYMVSFLLDNSLGAWWAGRRLTASDLATAQTEEELRAKAGLPGVPLEYLRFVKQEDGVWRPAAGKFAEWPAKLAEFRMMDPCCGSGHFLVATFLMLVAMRVEEEGLGVEEAVDAVLRENLHGLEIDRRCTEIAAFHLALTAWRVGGYRALPAPQIACTGLAIGGTREQWMDILSGQAVGYNERFFFGQLFDLFSKAPTLGSLINPERFLGSGWLSESEQANLHGALAAAMAEESKSVTERSEMGITAQGIAGAAQLLGRRYTLVATNVPYLGRGKQDEVLKKHLETNYPLGKADLATAFVLRCLEFCTSGGTTALVTPQNWLFLTTHTKLRTTLLENRSWNLVARLGHGAFGTISGHVVNVVLTVISATAPADAHSMAGIDVSVAKAPQEKSVSLRGGGKSADPAFIAQRVQLSHPDATVSFKSSSIQTYLGQYAGCYQGLTTSDDGRWRRKFWETSPSSHDWLRLQTPSRQLGLYSGREDVVSRLLIDTKDHQGVIRGRQAWGKIGIAVDRVGSLSRAIYSGDLFHSLVPVVVAHDEVNRAAVSAYCLSDEFVETARTVNQSLSIDNGYLGKLPFDLTRWQTVAAESYPTGLPEPDSDDPTQWLFHGHPRRATVPLQVAVVRLLGYRWPAELDETMRLSARAGEMVKCCDDLVSLADKDGIVCIPPVRGESSAADRILNLLAKSYGSGWTSETLNGLLKDVGFVGKTLEAWLRDGFFAQHCEIFHHRPFVWQIWDGLRDGFSALLNYHKLDHKNLETLIYTYLGDWIQRQKDDVASGVDGAEERRGAAETLKKRLELILQGEAPYDIFVRWKSIDKQPIGWVPDLNDGVWINIRPFVSVPSVNMKGAGVLRVKPNIRSRNGGKEPKRPVREFPWFWNWDGTVDFEGGDEFTGERVNDCHYTLEYKRKARERAKEETTV
ncbi:MAG: SAM-dependent DNA methyltransferase [Acidobacteria bacterium]|nr:SAM-dependent DNA methyltransferase [Acidobacteriota bacterium]